jgi:hypothetical protein
MPPAHSFEAITARARESSAPPATNIRAEMLSFFSRVPEAPLYRRRDEPSKIQAAALLTEIEPLLSLAYAQGVSGLAFSLSLEAHLRYLIDLAQGNIEAAEPKWQHALELERAATLEGRLFQRSDDGPKPVFDRRSGASRYDEQTSASIESQLVCPQCRQTQQYRFSLHHAWIQFTCPACKKVFKVYFADAREVTVRGATGQRKHYDFKLEELTSRLPTHIEVSDAAPELFKTSRRDLLAFLYAPDNLLRGVLNLSSSHVLWVGNSGPCFIATAIFGAESLEVFALRRFRDEVLFNSSLGTRLVCLYYRWGSILARGVVEAPLLKLLCRAFLIRVADLLLHRLRP